MTDWVNDRQVLEEVVNELCNNLAIFSLDLPTYVTINNILVGRGVIGRGIHPPYDYEAFHLLSPDPQGDTKRLVKCLYVSLCFFLSFSLSSFLCSVSVLSLCLTVSHCLSLSLCDTLCFCLSVCLSLLACHLSACGRGTLSVFLCLSLCLSVFVIPPCLSVFVSMSLS